MKKILYINAGAGSGKTYRLTHDLADLLAGTNKNGHNPERKQIDPSEIIVTTFTVAAANEIKERARKVLLENKEKDMSAVAAKLETATIGTIHSVAQMFINKYWYAIGMVPEPDVMSDTDKKLYRNQSIAQMLSGGKYATEREKIQKYYDTFRPKKQVDNILVDYPEFWTEMLDKIVGKMSYYEIEDLTNSKADSLAEVDKVFTSDVVPDEAIYTAICKDLVETIKSKIQTKIDADGDEAKTATDLGDFEKAEKLPRKLSYPSVLSLYSIVKSYTSANESIANHKALLEEWIRYKETGKTVKDCIDALFTLAEAWKKDYDTYKKKMGVIDYDDMEKSLRALLKEEKNKAIQEEIAKQYQLVMVDEFQDCNPIQLEIFNLLSDLVGDNSKLAQSSVWVGDPNQSIYGFRGSNTELINEVADKFPKDANGEPDYDSTDESGLKRDKLDTSYRSRGALVELAYSTFGPLFSQMVKLNVVCPEHKCYKQAVYHWHFGDNSRDETKEFYLNLAMKIKETVEDGEYYIVPKDTSDSRKLKYEDIAILVRTHNEATKLAYEMKCANVPVSVPENNIMDRIEVQLMMALMHLAERCDDHEWASVMHLWCDIDTKDVIRKSIDDYTEIQKLDEGEKYDKWYTKEAAYKSISEAISVVKEMSFSDKMSNLILLLSVNEKVAKWGEADTRRQNLSTLQAQAVAFVNRCNRMGIDATVEEFGIYLNDIDIKTIKDITSEAVKIVTYHGCKGLEWPMVILASLDHKNTEDQEVKRNFFGVNEKRVAKGSNEYNIITFPNFLGKSFPDSVKDVLVESEENKDRVIRRFEDTRSSLKGDAQRLMYVGMTRAREYLIAVTCGSSAKSNWMEEIGVRKGKGIDIFGVENGVAAEKTESIIPKEPKLKKSAAKDPERYKKAQAKNQEEYDRAMAVYNDRKASLNPHRHDIPLGQYVESSRLPLCDDGFDDAIVSPSKIVAEKFGDEKYESAVIDGVHFFPTGNADYGDNYAPMGTCIHNVFAAYDPTLPMDESVAMAEKVICQHGFKGCLAAERVINSISKLYGWLTDNYGVEKVYHEVPFCHRREDGTIIRGEMDLLWETPKGIVLIDFKNFVSPDLNAPFDMSKEEHYFGKYLPQMDAYTAALKADGYDIIARIIYYSTLGVVVEIK